MFKIYNDTCYVATSPFDATATQGTDRDDMLYLRDSMQGECEICYQINYICYQSEICYQLTYHGTRLNNIP